MVVVIAASSISALSVIPGSWTTYVRLHSEAIVIGADGQRVLVPAGQAGRIINGARVLASATNAGNLVADQQEWLVSGSLPLTEHAFGDMVRTALLDIRVLTLDNGASLAGWSYHWRYVWPRDSAFVAAALAQTGHQQDAARVLRFVQDVQEPDGRLQARYLPDGSGDAPDERGVQLDGTGLMLWSTWQVASTLEGHERVTFLEDMRPLVERSTTAALELIDNPQSLPPASQDYWERDEDKLTLGTAAPLLAGLTAAVDIHEALDESQLTSQAQAGARRLEAAIHAEFGPNGYPRYADGDGRDMAVGFLLPPFTRTTDPQVVTAWREAAVEMRRPAGGLAPGANWRRNGISWTPETAMFALNAAAIGATDTATQWMSWLDAHRTAAGSLPEKVLADGSPAEVAPLTLTAALVVLTAAELESQGLQ